MEKTREKSAERKSLFSELVAVKVKEKPIPVREVISKFEAEVNEINSSGDYESLVYLCGRQREYRVDAGYIEKRQKKLTWSMRAMLAEWMMQVSYEFSLKREVSMSKRRLSILQCS